MDTIWGPDQEGVRESYKERVIPRRAATIVTARTGERGLEVLLLKRPPSARFGPGCWVFPGGAVDPEDRSDFWAKRVPPAEERPSAVTAIRELFEETGLLLGTTRTGKRMEEVRRALHGGALSFSDAVEQLGADFRKVPIAFFARWITPRPMKIRFDTDYYLTTDADGEVTLTEEHVSARWETVGGALDAALAGTLPMMFPTRKTLELLAEFPTAEGALDALAGQEVPPVLVRLARRRTGYRSLVPGDRGYATAE